MSDNQFQVERRHGTVTIATPAANGTASLTGINGLSRTVDFLTPAMQDTDSTNFNIITESDGTVFSSGTVAQSIRTTDGTVFPYEGTMSIVAVGEGTQSADRDIVYDLYYTR